MVCWQAPHVLPPGERGGVEAVGQQAGGAAARVLQQGPEREDARAQGPPQPVHDREVVGLRGEREESRAKRGRQVRRWERHEGEREGQGWLVG